MQRDTEKYCMFLLPIQLTAETILRQQKELNTSQSAAEVFSLETVKWAAELPHAKGTLLRASHHARRRVQSQLCPSEAGM